MKNIWTLLPGNTLFKSLFVSIFISLFSIAVYQAFEHSRNGISIGIVNSEVIFTPEHYETHTHTYTDSNGKVQTYTTTEFIPDTWETTVRASNGRIEKWTTTNTEAGKNAKEEDVVKITDWKWICTIEYGKELNGNYSGAGSGGSY